MQTPLMPAWATDKMIEDAVTEVVFDIKVFHARIDQFVTEHAPKLVEETEALLKHEAEGW